MVNRRYTSHEFSRLIDDREINRQIDAGYDVGSIRGKQHNVMALVGNGFDIQVLKFLDKKINTSYHDFYNFLVWQKFDDSNVLFRQMKEQKEAYERNPKQNTNLKNWSDFESGIISILKSDENVEYYIIEKSLEELQVQFSIFLNEVVTPEVNDALGSHAQEFGLAKVTCQKFVGDLAYNDICKCNFGIKTNHYDIYNWQIFNFNYTSLLDNYIYLDRKQFDPHPHTQADTNFWFYPNPQSISNNMNTSRGTAWSSYMISNIVHPHGYQDIPKSMLFGVDNVQQMSQSSFKKLNNFTKPYWAQNDLRYAHLFEDTNLYIIFGMSLGETDQWWWRKIVDSLEKSDAELILYNHCRDVSKASAEVVKNRFLKSAGWVGAEKEKYNIINKIYVVNFDNNTPRFAFSMNPPAEM